MPAQLGLYQEPPAVHFKNPRRICKLVRRGSGFGGAGNVLDVKGRRGHTGLVAEREDDFVVADTKIQNEVVGDLAGPEALQDVGRLNLQPAGFLR